MNRQCVVVAMPTQPLLILLGRLTAVFPCYLPGEAGGRCTDKQFEKTFENAQWRKVKDMQPMLQGIFSNRTFEAAFENPQWRKVKQMQPV